MTIATTHPGSGELDRYEGDYGDLGMEDVGAAELSIPRLEIVHDEAEFRNRNTDQRFPKLRAVILGVVKQRIMWDKEVDDGDKPQCRSTDFELGWPQHRTDIPKDKQFPWAKSNFDAADFEPDDENGLIALPCQKCVFKEWNTALSKVPLCSEQFAFPLLYQNEEGGMEPAILTLQRSAAKSCKQYISGFKTRRRPMFTVFTELNLTLQSRGKVKYSVPSFRQLEATEGEQWDEYANFYRQVREFLRQKPRGPQDEDEDGEKTSKPMASAKAATKLKDEDPWATAAAPAAAAEDDDLPF